MRKSTETKVKTTIDIAESTWRSFSIKVIQDFGGRKKNDVIESLIEAWLKGDVTV